jgi:hypothetical protein
MAQTWRAGIKKRGAKAQGTMIGVRLQADQLESLDAWIRHQPDNLSRPEAVRRLISLGLHGQ